MYFLFCCCIIFDLFYNFRSRNYVLVHSALTKKVTGNRVSLDHYNATIQHILSAETPRLSW